MISNKTAAILFLITVNMKLVASTTPGDTQGPSSTGKLVFKKRPKLASGKTENVLGDDTSTVGDVEVQVRSTEVINTSQELPVPQVKSQFKTLIEQGEYKKIFELGEKMSDEEFLKQLCPVVKRFEQYNGIADYLENLNLVASFYAYGDVEVVKGAIVKSKLYDEAVYITSGNLEAAFHLAFKEDQHDRIVDLLNVRQEATAEVDEQRKRNGERAGFDYFVSLFFLHLAPWDDGIAFKRFFTFHGDELRDKHQNIIDTLSEKLVWQLKARPGAPEAVKLLIDFIGQPSLLTPEVFAKGFLYETHYNQDHSDFVKYAWREAIQEGLKKEYPIGGEKLWQAMQEKQPDQFTGQFPDTEEARTAVLKHFPTKRQKEEQWIEKHAPGFLREIDLVLVSIIPKVLVPIVIGYARPTWLDF